MAKSSKNEKRTTRKNDTPEVSAPRPRQKKGPVLDVAPIHLERSPLHGYGTQRHVDGVENRDVLYLGTQQNLSAVEVVAVKPVPSGADRLVEIHVLALDLLVDGVRYDGREQVVLIAEKNARVAVSAR
jgi:hypothetical protein